MNEGAGFVGIISRDSASSSVEAYDQYNHIY